MSQQATVTPNTNTQNTNIPEHGTFSGRYAQASKSIYVFLVDNAGIGKAKAHKIAHQYACDFGAAIKAKGSEEVKSDVSKMTKEQTGSLKETATTKVKGHTLTVPLRIGHAIQWIGDAGAHGVSYGHTNWVFSDDIANWIEKLEA